MSLAWHIAALSRQEKLPDLRKLLEASVASGRKPTHVEQLSYLQQLSARYGIELQRTRLVKIG